MGCAVGASTRVVPQCPVNSCRSLLNRPCQNPLWQVLFRKSQQAARLGQLGKNRPGSAHGFQRAGRFGRTGVARRCPLLDTENALWIIPTNGEAF